MTMEEREAKFTPGPWSISQDDDDFDVVHDDLNAVVCLMPHSSMLRDRLRPLPNADADAALIAAAPDLYAALEKATARIVGMIDANNDTHDFTPDDPEADEDVVAFRAALKKARGET